MAPLPPNPRREPGQAYSARDLPCLRCCDRMCKQFNPATSGEYPCCEEDATGSAKCSYCGAAQGGKPCLAVPVKHQAAMRALKLATEAVAKNGYTGVFKTAGQKALQKGKNDKALSAEKRAAADQQEAGEYSARRLAAADRLAQAAERSAAAAEVSAAALQQIAGSLAKLVTIQSEIRENYTLVNHDALVGAADDEEDGENQEGDGEVAA
ncbi:hypothetical protein BN1723_014543 [Verticillium longisporum]|nr:hypothetical protein BN1723_014543 [Verticillium longisporum]